MWIDGAQTRSAGMSGPVIPGGVVRPENAKLETYGPAAAVRARLTCPHEYFTAGEADGLAARVQVRPLSRTVIDSFRKYAMGLPEVLSVFVVASGDDFLVHLAGAERGQPARASSWTSSADAARS